MQWKKKPNILVVVSFFDTRKLSKKTLREKCKPTISFEKEFRKQTVKPMDFFAISKYKKTIAVKKGRCSLWMPFHKIKKCSFVKMMSLTSEKIHH